MKLEFHPEAVIEARAARLWYQEKSPAVAETFIRELDTALERITKNPDIRAKYSAGTRRCFLNYFPFAVVYRTNEESVQVIAIAHGRRRPGYWKDRL